MVVQDLGLVLSGGRLAAARKIRHDGAGGALLARYQTFLGRVAGADAIRELAAAPLKDEMLAVILARLLGDVALRWASRGLGAADLPAASPIYELDREALAGAHDPAWALGFVQRLVEHERGVLARLDQIEIGSLRLLGLFSTDGGAAGRRLVSSSDGSSCREKSTTSVAPAVPTRR